MKKALAPLVFFVSVILIGCASPGPQSQRQKQTTAKKVEVRDTANVGPDISKLKGILGLNRQLNDLGYAEKSFDSCRVGLTGETGKCGPRVLTVVNFRLLCRDSEDTAQDIVSNFTPVVTDQVKWKVAEVSGVTRTDTDGYGSVQVISSRSLRGQRLVLTVGRQFLGLTVADVNRIVVPVYWCTQVSRLLKTSVLSKTAAR